MPALPPGVTQKSAGNGQTVFMTIGCGNCHSPTLTTAPSSSIDPALANVTYHPYSDFALHHMGGDLADDIEQGAAGKDQFRTAPLWGLGQRLFLLHDGRTANLIEAIHAHRSSGSEATMVINNFDALTGSDPQDLLNFLRSL
jgi:CxxC motif-containing protein (DUF1111 family)